MKTNSTTIDEGAPIITVDQRNAGLLATACALELETTVETTVGRTLGGLWRVTIRRGADVGGTVIVRDGGLVYDECAPWAQELVRAAWAWIGREQRAGRIGGAL
jgi:hypothetical protein